MDYIYNKVGIMAKQISVSIPDELHEKTKKLKGQLKVSKVCQEALANAAVQIDKKTAGEERGMSVIERLKSEMMEGNKDIIDEEANDYANAAVQDLSYEDLRDYKLGMASFTDESPADLYELYGDPAMSTSSDMYISFQLRQYFYKQFEYWFYMYLDMLCSDVFD
jgi:post-segregation antitoxin (ccd killing protein)